LTLKGVEAYGKALQTKPIAAGELGPSKVTSTRSMPAESDLATSSLVAEN
jgi:hypothetical protein